MRIESVTAEAFGPLTGDTLTLSPGLTVIHGDNESAKSSWHAAIYAALCGRRRGRGASTTDDREFAARRRPWDGNSWKVRCVVSLDDGRKVDLQHDLDGKVDCRAVDERGRDVSSDIMYDGAPDGSRWLGLNRRTFAATACVNQAELLRVLEAADELQKDLQRAAASAGKDETAAAALAALREFRKTAVGKDQANSRRPLRCAIDGQRRAVAALAEAQRAHADYLLRVVESEAAQQSAAAAGADRHQTAAAQASAERLVQAAQRLATTREAVGQATSLAQDRRAQAVKEQGRLGRAQLLSASLPDAEPASSNADDVIAQRAARAIGGWQSAPEIARLTGPTSHELQAQVDDLPPMPDGDVAVDPSVERLRDTYLRATAVADRSRRSRIDMPAVSDPLLAAAVNADPATLRWLAERLTEPVTDPDAQLVTDRDAAADKRAAAAAALDAAEQRESAALEAVRKVGAVTSPAAGPRSLGVMTTVAGALLLAIGLALIMAGRSGVGTGVAALGAGALAASALLRRSARAAATTASLGPLDTELQTARSTVRECRDQRMLAEHDYVDTNSRLEAAQATAALSAGRWHAAAAEAARLGLPVDAHQLATLAEQAQRVASRRESFERWQHEHAADQRAQRSSRDRLAEALAGRGYAENVDVLEAFSAYEHDCAARHEQARQARRREELTQQLDDRIGSERAAERAQQGREAAADELVRTVEMLGLAANDPSASMTADVDALTSRLREWLDDRSVTLQRTDEQRQRWQELQTLLDGHTLDDLAAAVSADLLAASRAEQASRSARAACDAATSDLARAAGEAGVDHPVTEQAARELLDCRRRAHDQTAALERELGQRASNHQGMVAERAQSIPNVAEAEEAVDRAQQELQRVRSLDEVLGLTSSYLQSAQDQAYSDLAPVLNNTLDRWLPEVTGGRYRRARVNPETLEVLVESETGALRSAELLSVGTTEQVYLLLRVALAEHLATKSTVSPLLLDDVTVQSDPTRTEAILRMCKALADDGRQIVLFAQEPSVATWAEKNLDGTSSRLVRLTVPKVA